MAGSPRGWPRFFAHPPRALIAGPAAADAGLPAGSEGAVLGRLAPRGLYCVLVDAGDAGDAAAAPGHPLDRAETRAALQALAAAEGLGALGAGDLAWLRRVYLFRAEELTRLPADPPV